MSKPMTAAEYSAHVQKVKASEPTEIVTLKSGSVFELRRPDIQAYVVMGRYPKSLVSLGVKALEDNEPKMTPEEQEDARVFMIQVVRQCLVNPPLDTIEDDILVQDVYEIFSWAMNHTGVAGIDGLRSFRKGSEGGVVSNKPAGKKLRHKAVASVAG